jgi:hypothetical protein
MKKRTTTKEQLIAEMAKLRQSYERLVSGDERKRKEFAKAFNWMKEVYGYNERDALCPTWEQIFIETGKLLAVRAFYDFEGNISELDRTIED